MAQFADTPVRAWEGHTPRLPVKDARNEAILAWLPSKVWGWRRSGTNWTRAGCKMHRKQASVPSPVSSETVPVRNAVVLQVADIGSATRQETAPARC
jgi:hypothetical protein